MNGIILLISIILGKLRLEKVGLSTRLKVTSLMSIILHIGASGQDQLFKTDNTKTLVEILEVGPEEVKYKLYNDLKGPIYIENKKNVALIVYQNGDHQAFNEMAPPIEPPVIEKKKKPGHFLAPADSILIYRDKNSLSANVLNFFNREVGLSYRHEFYESRVCFIVPFAIGISAPPFTQRAYFDHSEVRIVLGRKLFEIGVGTNYYPFLKSAANYYIGPVFKYMQYKIDQEARMRPGYIAWNSTVLSRYTLSLTNGVVLRTKSGLVTDFFLSMGLANDRLRDNLVDPAGVPVSYFPEPVSFYFWTGLLVGFCF